MRRIWVLAVCGLLAGCAGKMIDKGLTSMMGQPLSAAIAKLGVPTDEREIAGQKVYTWFSACLSG